MMMLVGYILIGLIIVGMCVVRVRSDRSRLSVLIPGLNYYTRTQIAGRSLGLSIATTLTNLMLLAIIIVARYRLAGRAYDSSIGYNIIHYLQLVPELISNYRFLVVVILILQIWVNWGVAHRWGRGLLTGLELTLLAPIFWLVLGLSTRPDISEPD